MNVCGHISVPEFLNRLDETTCSMPLTKDNIGGIIHLIIADLNRRLEDKQLTIRLSWRKLCSISWTMLMIRSTVHGL